MQLAGDYVGSDHAHSAPITSARYVAGRYAALDVTWQAVEEFEGEVDARPLLNEFGRVCAEIRRHYPDELPRSIALPAIGSLAMAAE